MNEYYFCAIGFNNRFRSLLLQFYLLFSRKKVYLYKTFFSIDGLIHSWFIKNCKINFINKGVGEINGLSYELHKKSIELTKLFFNKYLSNAFFIKYENKSLITSKYGCYIKKKLVFDISEIITGLYLIKEFSKGRKVIIINSPLNRFIVEEFLKYNKVNFDICWLGFSYLYLLIPVSYYLYIIKKIFTNGFMYKNRIKKKIYRGAIWGLSRPILKDDFIIDNINFRKEDIVFYRHSADEEATRALQQVKAKGYLTVDINKCKLNIKNNFLLFINLFLIKPLWMFMILFCNKMMYQVEYLFKFYIDAFPHFLFLTNYNSRCHISNSDGGEVAETIIMNRLGCNNILYHWSDMSSFKSIYHAFPAHNIFYTWGAIHYNFHKEEYFYDKVKIVGCFLLKPYFDALERKKNMDKMRKIILFCDTSFGNEMPYPEDSYLDYLDLLVKMLNEVNYADFIFKPKNNKDIILNQFSSEEKIKIYYDKINYLYNNNRFVYYDDTFQIESLIAYSDIVITMGMTSPSTIALILRKEAIYYDVSGNNQHPMTQYRNKVVFDNKELLINRVKSILDNEESVFDNIDPELLNQYEPFQDAMALERLIVAIHNETIEK